MKIMITKGTRRLIVVMLCLFLTAIAVVNIVGYIFNLKYVSVFAAVSQIDKFEIRSGLLMDAMDEVGACTPEKAVDTWASGVKTRSAALQYASMSKELKADYANQLDKNFPNWVTGVSSPRIEKYEIKKQSNSTDKSTYNIKFFAATSTGPAGQYNAVLTVQKEGDYYRITKIEADKELFAYTGYKPS